MPLGDDPIFQRRTGGATLLVDPMPRASGVAIGLWFETGSALEAEDERGLSHYVEHMVFKGAGDRSAQELSRAIDRVGGYLNAFTEREVVCLHCLIPLEHAGLALGILLDMAYRPRFTREEFEREKDIIANEIVAAEDDLEEAAQDEFFAMTYKGHPASRKIAGRVVDIAAASFERLGRFYEERFARGPITISVAGAVSPEAIAERVYRSVPEYALKVASRRPLPRAETRRERRMVKAAGNQVFVFTGLSIPAAKTSEDTFWRLTTASSAYGESMSSRLFMRLREELGLCYSISSSFSLSKMASLWGVAASTSPSQFPRFAGAYEAEARSLFERGFEGVEVEEAVSRLKGLLRLASDDPEYRMKRMARQSMYGGEVEAIGRTMARFMPGGSVDPDSVNAVVKDCLDPEAESVLLYGKLSKAALKAGASVFGAEAHQQEES